MTPHPTPWRVAHWAKPDTYQDYVIKDANGNYVIAHDMTSRHTVESAAKSNSVARRIVEAVNHHENAEVEG